MKVFLLTLAPLSIALDHAPRPVRALSDFRAAGHQVFVAAPLAGRADDIRRALDVQAVLPLRPVAPGDWSALALNAARVALWARRWRPDLFLSVGARAATLAHAARGAARGSGISLLVLPAVQGARLGRVGAAIERRAIHECDRLVTYDAALSARLVRDFGARGGDLLLLPGDETAPFVTLAERLLAEAPRSG